MAAHAGKEEGRGEEEGRSEVVAAVFSAAMSLPAEQRGSFVEEACADPDLRAEILERLDWEERMDGFLLVPFIERERFDRPFQPGQSVLDGRFRIARVAGEGGMGVVYEAFDESLGMRVAIKCPRFEYRKRLSAEVRKSLLVMHRNACRVYNLHTEQTETGPVDFLSMEFLEGETLAAWLERVAPKWPQSSETASVVRQILDGLEAVHQCGVVHRDLKPGNVMLTPDAAGLRAVITDFGIAEMGDIHSSNARGAPAYVAPELWKGEHASMRSDIYALGVILFVMVTGRTPFAEGVGWDERLGKPPDLQGVPKPWRAALGRCLDPDPARRFASVAELRTALYPSRRWLIASGIAAAGVAAAESVRRIWFSEIRLAVLPPPAGSDPLLQGFLHSISYGLQQLRPARRKLRVNSPAQCALDGVRDPARAKSIFAATHLVTVGLNRDRVRIELTDADSGRALRVWEEPSVAGLDTRLFALQSLVIDGVIGELRLAAPSSRPGLPEPVYPEYLRALHLTRLDVGNALEAIPIFEKVVAAAPEAALAHAGLAEALLTAQYAKNDPAYQGRALMALARAEQLDPELPQVHSMLGRLHAAGGFWERALAEHRRAAQLDPSNEDSHTQMGYVLAYLGKMPEAGAAFESAVAIQPRSYRTRTALGLYYYEMRRLSEAEREWIEALRLAPGQTSVRTNLAALYLETGRTDLAVNEANESVKIRPTFAAMEVFGDVHAKAGRWSEAIDEYRRAISVSPQSYKIWASLADALRGAGRVQEAADAFRRGLELSVRAVSGNPRDPERLAWVAFYHAKLGEMPEARVRAEESLAISPTPMTRVRKRLILTFDSLGDRAAAVRLIEGAPDKVRLELAHLDGLSPDLRRDVGGRN